MEKHESSNATPHRRFRLRFTIAALMLVVAVVAGVLGSWFYYRPANEVVSHEVRVVSTVEMEAANWTWHEIADSPYRWTQAKEAELPSHTDKFKPRKISNTIFYWPQHAHADTWNDSDLYESDTHPIFFHMSGELGGCCGVRTAGGRLQLRVEDEIHYQYQDREAWIEEQKTRFDEVEGKLYYEGYAPEECLVFAAPLRKGDHHLVIVRIEEQEDSQSKTSSTKN